MKVQIQYCMQEAAIMFLNVGLGMEMIWGQAACYKEITYAKTVSWYKLQSIIFLLSQNLAHSMPVYDR